MLVLITGCMFSGKTKKLVEILRQSVKHRPVMAFHHVKNTRDDVVRSRDGLWFPAKKIRNEELLDLDLLRRQGATIGIDEAQFFDPGILHAVALSFESDKESDLYLSGLSFDSEMREWGALHQLRPHAVKVFDLFARCAMCQKDDVASRTFYQYPKTKSERVGDDGYEPRCIPCWESGEAQKKATFGI